MRNIPLQIKNILKEVAEELEEPYDIVEDVFYHQFEFLKDCMEKAQKGNDYSEYNNILLKHLGTFYASKGRIDYMTKIFKKHTEDGRSG